MSDRAGAFEAAARRVVAPDAAAARAARARHDRLLKPPGSLGALEDLGARLAGMAGTCPPPPPDPVALAVFAGDHGVVARGVTPWPSEVTAAMVGALAGGRAAAPVLAAHLGVRLVVVDVGVAGDIGSDTPTLERRRVRSGTADLVEGPAMTAGDATAALDTGASVAAGLVDDGARCLLTGEMGIGNTTPAAALLALLCGASAEEVTGPGTGVDAAGLSRKLDAVRLATERTRAELGDDPAPFDVLASVGGLEIAALAGFAVGGAAAGVPVVLDGVVTASAAVVARALVPHAAAWWIAGHRSPEPGAAVALDHLGTTPLLDLGLRLGEGTGALLAVPLLRSAAAVLSGMGTLDELA